MQSFLYSNIQMQSLQERCQIWKGSKNVRLHVCNYRCVMQQRMTGLAGNQDRLRR